VPTTPQHTFSNNNQVRPFFNADDEHIINVKLSPSLTIAKGTILGEVSADPGTYAPYASANSNGTQNPKLILTQSVVTDASSNVTRAGEHGATVKHAPAYNPRGTWRTQDLVGLDAGALAALQGALVQGDLTTGLVRF
jgi:hypothetical protein